MEASKADPAHALQYTPSPASFRQGSGAMPRVRWQLLLVLVLLIGVLAVHTLAPFQTLDPAFADELHRRASPVLTTAMLAISALHGLPVIALVSAALALVLARQRQQWWVLLLIIAVPGGMLINALLKLVFARMRPGFDDPIILLHTYSFPSGHVAASTVFYVIVAALLSSRTRSIALRAAAACIAALMIVLVAFSRLYLGVHYLSDVIGGLLESLIWLALCFGLVNAWARHRITIHGMPR